MRKKRIIRIRDVKLENPSKGNYIYLLSKQGKIKRYKKGNALAFDEVEYQKYCKQEHRGRPLASGDEIIEIKGE